MCSGAYFASARVLFQPGTDMQVRDNVIGQDRGSVIVRKDIRQTWYLDSQMRGAVWGFDTDLQSSNLF